MIKEEVVEEEKTQTPRPIEGLHEIGAPPFLTKTYDMVDDPATDEIVSWSNAKNSFIVWDSNKFSTDLLPRYFKHSNFSSFIRQLNTYGFRKINPDRWEFANEGFLKGQKHLLKSIKRRRHAAQNVQHQGGASACVEVGQFGLEGVLERLKRDCSVLMTEIVRLKQQQHESRGYIVALQNRLRAAERKQQQMMVFLAKAFNNPGVIQQFMLESAERNVLDGANVRRKRRITAAQSTGEENFQEQQIDNLAVHDELNTLFRANVETGSGSSTGVRVERTEPMAVTGESNLDSVNEMLLDELLGENLELDNEDQLCFGDIPEVDDLEGQNPSDWDEDFHDLVDQMNYFQSKP